jgi:hypothetical protein
MTVDKLQNIEKAVEKILRRFPETRGDDYLLYLAIVTRYRPDLYDRPISDFLMHHKELNVPNVKSIERARRKMQAKYPELAANDDVKKNRKEEEKAYVAYALEG